LFSCSIFSCSRAASHPFYVPAQERFVPAGELQVGDQLVSSQGVLVPIESISNLNEITTVYNLRVADHHTYFVGGDLWGWDVWVHNAYKLPTTANSPLSRQQVEIFSGLYFDAIAKGSYRRATLIDEVKRLHGIELNSNQQRQIRHYLKNEVFNDVTVIQRGNRTYVDFGSYAVGSYSISKKHLKRMEESVSHLNGEKKMRELRRLHETYLTNKYGVDMQGMTWHHMEAAGNFQRVPVGLHKLFAPHDGLVTW
jgi:hypothetical protein